MTGPGTPDRHSRLPPLLPLHQDSRKVFQSDDETVWVAVNVSWLPARRDSELGNVFDVVQPRYYNEKFPYLCAVLLPDALTGDFLGQFRNVSVIQQGASYGMRSSQVRAWEACEALMFTLCRLLLTKVNTTLEFALPLFPYKTGYKRVFPDEGEALLHAYEGQYAFCVLFGMASYLIALTHNWKAVAIQGGLPCRWVEAVENCPIATFHLKEGRVGSFIDLSQSVGELRNLPTLASKNIPFWIYWGRGEGYDPILDDAIDAHIARVLFKPTTDELEYARRNVIHDIPQLNVDSFFYQTICPSSPGSLINVSSQTDDFALDSNNDLHYAIESTPDGHAASLIFTGSTVNDKKGSVESVLVDASLHSANTDGPPPVEAYTLPVFLPGQLEENTRQNSFITPEQFWQRQHAEDEARLAKMPESLRKKLKNERRGDSITKESKVYYWEKTTFGHVRRLVARRELQDFAKYPNTQMRFSVTRNEWDVCSDFDPDAEKIELLGDNCDNSDDEYCNVPDCKLHRVREPTPPLDHYAHRNEPRPHRRVWSPSTTSAKTLHDLADPIYDEDHFAMHEGRDPPQEVMLTERDFQHVLDERYSYRPDLPVRKWEDVALDRMLYYRYGLILENIASFRTSCVEQDPEEAWAKTRGVLYDVESVSLGFSVPQMLGITRFIACILEDHPLPSTLHDLHAENPHIGDLRDVASVLNIQKVFLGKAAYLLRPHECGPHEQGFVLVVEDASLVVEIMRRAIELYSRGPLDIRDFVALFAGRGSPFRTLRPARDPRGRLDHPAWDLGYRSLDDPPYAFAYAQYEASLRAFLLRPRARSALGLGGPVWRVIMEFLNPSHAVLGPSDEVTVYGRPFPLPDGTVLWEDTLTESEQLFLCGTYKVKKGSDMSLYSWWPSPRQWEAATPNVRYWSPGNERWFMSRLSDIRNGRTSWVRMADWPHKLRNNKKTKRLMKKNTAICEYFVDEHCTTPTFATLY